MQMLMDNLYENIHWTAPQITLSAVAETGQVESTITVPKQRSYTGKWAIPSALADTPCANLGYNGVLSMLNTILRTSYASFSATLVLHSCMSKVLTLEPPTLICAPIGRTLQA